MSEEFSMSKKVVDPCCLGQSSIICISEKSRTVYQ